MTIDLAAILELIAKPPRRQVARDAVEVPPVLGCEVTGGDQARRTEAGARAQSAIRVGEHVQPFLGSDAGEIADRERPGSARRPQRVTIEVDPERDQPHLLRPDAQVTRHVVVPTRQHCGR